MSEELLINISPMESRVAVLDNSVLSEIYIERNHKLGLVGNIYLGTVVRVLPGMQAAFVDIGQARTAFLHVNDMQRLPSAANSPMTSEPSLTDSQTTQTGQTGQTNSARNAQRLKHLEHPEQSDASSNDSSTMIPADALGVTPPVVSAQNVTTTPVPSKGLIQHRLHEGQHVLVPVSYTHLTLPTTPYV